MDNQLLTYVTHNLLLMFDRQHVCDVICNVGYKNYYITTDYITTGYDINDAYVHSWENFGVGKNGEFDE